MLPPSDRGCDGGTERCEEWETGARGEPREGRTEREKEVVWKGKGEKGGER